MTGDGARTLPAIAVTPNYFEVLGVRAIYGRVFDAHDVAQPGRAALLAYTAWRHYFNADPAIVGRSVTLGATTFDVVGVLPAEFYFPTLGAERPEIVTVLPAVPAGAHGGTFYPIVRREVGVSREEAQTRVDRLVAQVVARDPGRVDNSIVLEDVKAVLYPTGRPILRLLLASAGLVLLIGSANLASMLLGHAHQRAREIGVRAALGASRLRLVRPVIFEAIVIGLCGALLALVVTTMTFSALLRQVPSAAYRTAPVGVDLRVAIFAIGLGCLSGLLFAALPAWRAGAVDVQTLLQRRRDAARSRGRFTQPMVVVQVALAVLLVFGAIVTARAFLSVLRVPLGVSPRNVMTIAVLPDKLRGAALQAFYVRVIDALGQRSDVEVAGAASRMPLESDVPAEGVEVDGVKQTSAGIFHILPGYFEAVGIRLLRGRLPDRGDVDAGSDLAVLSETASRILFHDRDPLGSTVTNGRGRRLTVVGIVADARLTMGNQARHPVYVIPADATRALRLVVRTRDRSDMTMTAITRDVTGLAPGRPVTAAWWADSIAQSTPFLNPRFQTLVLGGFAAVALALTAIGIAGVVSFLVTSRTREMGVRMAIGATPRSLMVMMVAQSLIPVAIGIVAGLTATRWAARLAEAQLFKVDTHDPLTLSAAAATVIAAAALAAYLPARRAARIDPVAVLRAD
jgi:putative ABC transport system permease protein